MEAGGQGSGVHRRGPVWRQSSGSHPCREGVERGITSQFLGVSPWLPQTRLFLQRLGHPLAPPPLPQLLVGVSSGPTRVRADTAAKGKLLRGMSGHRMMEVALSWLSVRRGGWNPGFGGLLWSGRPEHESQSG